MAQNEKEQLKIYFIPDNYIGEKRVFQGQIRLRYLFDCIILGLLFAIAGLLLVIFVLPNSDVQTKITILLISASPGIILGFIGFNGDPISTAIVNFFAWRKGKEIRIYNGNPRLLGTDPVKALTSEKSGKDVLISKYHDWQINRIEDKMSEEYIEGENFEFKSDPSVDNFTEDNGDYTRSVDENDAFRISVNVASGGDLSALESFFDNDDDEAGEEDDGMGY